MKPVRRIPLSWLAWEDVALYFARGLHGRRILDFGCGQGVLLSRLSRDNALFGVDVSRRALERCAERCGDAVRLALVSTRGPLPFADRTFDAITCTEVIEHVPDDGQVIRELARVLVPGGVLILSTPHQHWLSVLDLGNLKFRFRWAHRLYWTLVRQMSRADYEARYGGRAGLVGDVSVQEDPWHRHYCLADLQRLFAGLFRIERYYIFGPMARIIWPVGAAVGRVVPPLGLWLKRLDHASRRCFASQGHDICVLARRCTDGERA